MPRTLALVLALLLATPGCGGGSSSPDAAPPPPVDYAIVAADALAASAARYRDFRAGDGHQVDLALTSAVVGDATDVATASARLHDHVQALYDARDPGRPFFLLLLGDAQTEWPGDGTGVPTGTWTDPSTAAPVTSDNVYADLNGDDIPELAVGRITADSDAEADQVREKVAAYESPREVGPWDRRLNVFASTSGYGEPADSIIEGLAFDIVESVPYDYDVTMTYARQASPYVYVPEEFSDQVYHRINEGALLVAYIGHGYTGGFATLSWSGVSYPILDTAHLENIAVTHKTPILLFVACSTGAFDGAESVSERILVGADAPSAILSSTEESDPYANAIFVYESAQAFTALRAPTVGEAFVLAKQRMLGNDDSVRQQIDAVAAYISTPTQEDALKHSHEHMYTLFGDPAMAVVYAGVSTDVTVTGAATPGTDLAVTASLPGIGAGGQAVVTLESPRQTILGALAAVPADGDPLRDGVIRQNYATANDKVAASVTVPLTGPTLATSITVPADLPAGTYHVKVLASDASGDVIGSTTITVP